MVGFGDVYEYESEVVKNHQGSDVIINVAVQHSDYINNKYVGEAVQIAQAAIYAAQFAWKMEDYVNDFSKCNIVFNTDSYATGYNFDSDLITIARTTRGKVPYQDSWDTIMHEYGHFIIYHLTGLNPTGSQDWKSDLIVKYGKQKGAQLAWSEAWASMFSIMAQDKMGFARNDIPTRNDSRLTFIDMDFDLLSCKCKQLGEGNELAILEVLYQDYYDFKEISSMWRYGIKYALKTFSDFVNSMGSSWVIGDLLEEHGMGATELSASGLTFAWKAPKGSQNYEYVVVFYSSNTQELFRSSVISGLTYNISSSDWNKATQYGTNVKWTVYTYNTKDNIKTGPYPSKVVTY